MIALAFALTVTPAASQNIDPQARARQFLEVFAATPESAAQFVTNDAVMAVGDIGGPFNDYLKVIRRKPDWMSGCHIAELLPKPGLTVEQQKSPDLDPSLKHGVITVFDGVYACSRPDGSKDSPQFTIVLRDDRIVQFFIGQKH